MISHDGVNLWIRSPISGQDRPLLNAEQVPTSPPVRRVDRECVWSKTNSVTVYIHVRPPDSVLVFVSVSGSAPQRRSWPKLCANSTTF